MKTSTITTRAAHALTLLSATALTIALSACGGGGGGGSSNTGTGTTTTGTTGQSLLDTYTVPAAIAAEKTANYPTAFDASTTYLQSNCQAGKASTTVYVGPNTLVYATTGVSDKAQALAADYAEQSIGAIKSYFGLDTSVVGFDGTKVQVCADNTLGASVGDDTTGVSGQGAFRALDVMSADSANFAARYPGATSLNAPVGTSYFDLYRHEMTHVYAETAVGAIASGSLERWFNEGLATTVSQLPVPSKATVLGYAQQDLIVPITTASTDMTVYPAYEATIQMIVSTDAAGLKNGVASIPAFLSAYKQNAVTACSVAIPSGITEPAYLTDGMPAGTYNGCYEPNGGSSTLLVPVFDATFRQVFREADGVTPLLLHTADGGNALEPTLASRLAAFLP